MGQRDFRLTGLGAYLREAADRGGVTAIGWGIGMLVLVIVILDQCVSAPAPRLVGALQSGGAWNASIVAEYFDVGGQSLIHYRRGSADYRSHGGRHVSAAVGLHARHDRRRHHDQPLGLAPFVQAGRSASPTGVSR